MDINFIELLPALYQNTSPDSFFMKFLSLYQKIFLDFQKEIEGFVNSLDADAANTEELFILAEWLCFEEFKLLAEARGAKHDENVYRQTLKKAVEYYKRLGTKAAISEIITELCGEIPLIVEHHEEFCFTVFLNKIHPALPELMEYIKPAYTQGNLVLYKDEIRLNNLSYLDVNSYLDYTSSETQLNFIYLDSLHLQ
ncbi:MAG: phage tail protein [Defluviitaleaceae bacterium]|nr:phage tail protein [Defluviitaleaceae bacterium]